MFSCGPYTLQGAWEPGRGGLFVRNESWSQSTDPVRKAYPDQIRYQEGLTPQAVAQQVMADGETGRVSVSLGSAPPAIQQHITAVQSLDERSVNPLTGLVDYLVPNTRSEVFADEKVRLALAAATNREAYVTAIGGPTAAEPSRSLLPRSLPAAHDEDPIGTGDRGDAARAAALLEEAGVDTPVEFTVAYRSTPTADKAMAALVAGWREAGFEPTTKPITEDYFPTISDPDAARGHRPLLVELGTGLGLGLDGAAAAVRQHDQRHLGRSRARLRLLEGQRAQRLDGGDGGHRGPRRAREGVGRGRRLAAVQGRLHRPRRATGAVHRRLRRAEPLGQRRARRRRRARRHRGHRVRPLLDGVCTAGPARLLFVHAHPDDETLTTGVAIAHHVARGDDVHVLTCTLGEEGEVIPAGLAHLEGRGEELAAHRRDELARAMDLLGVTHHLLGPDGPGAPPAFRDSGMAGSAAAADPRAFAGVPLDVAADAVREVVERVRPDVVRHLRRGRRLRPSRPRAHPRRHPTGRGSGSARRAPVLLGAVVPLTWAAQDREWLAAHVPAGEGWVVPGEGNPYAGNVVPDEVVTRAVVDAEAERRRTRALREHETQVVVGEGWYALSNRYVFRLSGREGYARLDPATGRPVPEGAA